MGEFLPILIALAVYLIIGVNKKKAPPVHDDTPHTPETSPWDDLMEELRRRGGIDDEESPVPTPKPVHPTVKESKELTPYFTYEAPVEQKHTFSYEEPMPSAVATVLTATPTPAVAPSGVTAPADEQEGNGGPFDKGFDARLAILYSEIFQPKCREY